MEINEILRDFQRRYDNGFVWVKPPGDDEESLFYVNRITTDASNLANLELTSPEYGKIILNMGTAHTLRFKYPPVGVFQNGVDAFIFRRIPQKQYKHALYNGNSSVMPVWNNMLGRIYDRHAALKFDDVLAAFRGEHYLFKDALELLKSGKYRSVALSRNFSLCLSTISVDQYFLMHWETPVALVNQRGEVQVMYQKAYASVINQVKEA